MNPLDEHEGTAELYGDFGDRQARGSSECLSAWALAVAEDPEVLALIDSLPEQKRQPNLVFAAARWHGAAPGPYDGLRRVLTGAWPAVRETVLSRATQTNEVGRCATLLPVLASLPGPLALLEVGASAGLCLAPDRYSYRWECPDGSVVALDPPAGQSPVVLECRVEGDAPLPDRMPEVVWRGGLDLHPLDVHDDDATQWLQTLVWPEHEDRRARLASAVRLAREEPVPLVAGDLLTDLPALVEQVPADATLVVLHSAVLAYVAEADRSRFVRLVQELPGHWVSNEGPRVVPGLADRAAPPPPGLRAPFLLALDGEPLAWTEAHGRALWWS